MMEISYDQYLVPSPDPSTVPEEVGSGDYGQDDNGMWLSNMT